MIINPRGTGGSGKTELVRQVLFAYGWRDDPAARGARPIDPIRRAGRSRPLGYRLEHPAGGRSLAVLGHYEVTSGGCDTIRKSDGGLDEIMGLADQHVKAGYAVILEGLRLSSEIERTTDLARRHPLHILRLTTPPEHCIRNLARRRRVGQRAVAGIAQTVRDDHERIERACVALSSDAHVEHVDFEEALARSRELLGLCDVPAAASGGAAVQST
jgi:hypothetical protein